MKAAQTVGDVTTHRVPQTITEFIEKCEAVITYGSPAGKTFVAQKRRDRARVYALARLIEIAQSGKHIEEMLLAAPGLYEGLLQAYHRLLASRGLLWWQSNEHAKDAGWPRAVRAALIRVATHLDVDAKALANELDAEAYPWIRHLVIALAERQMQACP